jgi:CheY-like chemotaxis protein
MESLPYKVLYIEDQPEAVELVRLTLRRIGCEVTGAGDGLSGLEMMRRNKPDLLLLDLMLPVCDGWQVRRTMLLEPELASIPVVLVTARVPCPDPVNGKAPPSADAYLTKPFSLAEMRTTVRSLLPQTVPVAG